VREKEREREREREDVSEREELNMTNILRCTGRTQYDQHIKVYRKNSI